MKECGVTSRGSIKAALLVQIVLAESKDNRLLAKPCNIAVWNKM